MRPIDLAVVVANINGEVDIVDRELATTYERCVHFTDDALGDAAAARAPLRRRRRLCGLPGPFEPAQIQPRRAPRALRGRRRCEQQPRQIRPW